MSDQSGSSSFKSLLESALHDYEKQTGILLANHPLARQLQNCQSTDSITSLLQEQARALSEFRGSDKIMKALKSVVSALSKVSAIATLGQDIGMVSPRPLIGSSTFDPYLAVIPTCVCNTYWPRYPTRCTSLFRICVRIFVTSKCLRHLKAIVTTSMLLWICSSPWNAF